MSRKTRRHQRQRRPTRVLHRRRMSPNVRSQAQLATRRYPRPRSSRDAADNPIPPFWVNVVQRPVWDDYEPPRHRDVRLLLRKFESVAGTLAERQKRIEMLQKGSPVSKELGDYLAEFGNEGPANVTCCPVTTRSFRVWGVAQMLKLFQSFEIVSAVHLFYPEDDVPFGKLHTVDLKRIAMRERRRFERCVSPDVLAFGCIEAHADYEDHIWRVHMHVFVANCTIKQLELLRRAYFMPRPGRNRLMKIVPYVTRRPRAFAYALKFVTYRRQLKQYGPKRKKGERLLPPEHNEVMRHLARYTPSEFVFVINAERNNGVEYHYSEKLLEKVLSILCRGSGGM